MLKILFTNVPDNLIENHAKLDFGEAVKLTHELELQCREDKRVISSEFIVINQDGSNLYRGTFNFGSYDYPNIYHQINTMASRIKVNKQNQKDKLFLLEQIEKLTLDEYKKEELIDKTLINIDKSRISKLKKWQRIVIYSLTSLSLVAVVILAISLLTQKIQYEQALEEGRIHVKSNQNLIESYEYALLGNEEEFLKYLESQDLTDNQKRILANVYLNKSEYDKAVKTLEDTVYVETLIMTNKQLSKAEKIEKIKAYNELYPTNEARFDLAYFEGQYDLMMNLPAINMTIERSKMKTYGLMKLGRTDEAKVELNSNNDEGLKQKIDSYEVLKAEITTLEEKLVKEDKEKEKNVEAIQKIKEELNKKKEAFKTL